MYNQSSLPLVLRQSNDSVRWEWEKVAQAEKQKRLLDEIRKCTSSLSSPPELRCWLKIYDEWHGAEDGAHRDVG